jgi:hypothetical protein
VPDIVKFEPIVKSIAKSFTNNVFCRVVAPTSLEMAWPYIEIIGMGRCCVTEEDCHINKSLPVLTSVERTVDAGTFDQTVEVYID